MGGPKEATGIKYDEMDAFLLLEVLCVIVHYLKMFIVSTGKQITYQNKKERDECIFDFISCASYYILWS